MGEPTYFQDDVAMTARALEVAEADFLNGMNMGGSCAPGIGINMNEGAIVGTPEQFTLLDQGNAFTPEAPRARTPAFSQSIGGLPYVDRGTVPWPGSGGTTTTLPEGSVRFGDSPTQAAIDADPALNGTIIPIGNSTLVSLAGGWVIQP